MPNFSTDNVHESNIAHRNEVSKKSSKRAKIGSITRYFDGNTYFEDVDNRNFISAESTGQLISKVVYQTSKHHYMYHEFSDIMSLRSDPGIFPVYYFVIYNYESMNYLLL